MHLPALKDLRSIFKSGPKDTNTLCTWGVWGLPLIGALGKAIFLGRVGLDYCIGLDNHPVVLLHVELERTRSCVTIFTFRSIQLTIITKPSAEKKWSGFGLTSLTGSGDLAA